MANFASRLREVRKSRSLRQKDLADALNLAQTTIANYEQNTRFPDEATLARLADFLHVSFDYLLGRSDVNAVASNTGFTSASVQQDEGRIAAVNGVRPGGVVVRGARGELRPEARAYLDALLVADHEMAGELLTRFESEGMSVPEIYSEVFEPALIEVGDRWARAEADVFQEHLVSSATERFMATFAARFRPRPGMPAVSGMAVGGEFHQIGIRMIMDFLTMDGWNAHYLGVNLPADSVIRAITGTGSRLLAVSATMHYHRNQVELLIRTIRNSPSTKGVKVVVGGRAFSENPEYAAGVGADAFAPNAESIVSVTRQLLGLAG